MKRFVLRPLARENFQKTALIFVGFLFVVAGAIAGFHFAGAAKEGDFSAVPRADHVVAIYDDGAKKVIVTKEKTVAGALKDANLKVAPHDEISPKPTAKVANGLTSVIIHRARAITVTDGEKTRQIFTARQSAPDIAKAADVKMLAADVAELSPEMRLGGNAPGLVLTITRAKTVRLKFYGQSLRIRTQAKTVAGLLREREIKLGRSDYLSVAGSARITENMAIEIWRNGVQTVNASEIIPFATTQQQDPTKFVGYDEITIPGQNGEKTVTYQVEMKNGQEISRTKISEAIVTPPVTQVEVVGTQPRTVPWTGTVNQAAWLAAAGISPSDWGAVQYIVEHEGGWCPVRWQGDRGCLDHGSAPGGSGYGLVQATPGGKMSSAGADWLTNPVTQLRWATTYATKYGGWQGAYNHWKARHNW